MDDDGSRDQSALQHISLERSALERSGLERDQSVSLSDGEATSSTTAYTYQEFGIAPDGAGATDGGRLRKRNRSLNTPDEGVDICT